MVYLSIICYNFLPVSLDVELSLFIMLGSHNIYLILNIQIFINLGKNFQN